MKVTQMTYACLTPEPVFYPCPLFPSWFPASSLFLRDVNQGPTKRAQVLNLQGCPLQWKISCRGNNMKPNPVLPKQSQGTRRGPAAHWQCPRVPTNSGPQAFSQTPPRNHA